MRILFFVLYLSHSKTDICPIISGEHYLIGFYKRIDFYSTSTASIDFTIALNGRSNDVVFVDDVTFAVAGEMPQVEFYSLVTRERISSFKAHEVRVRCLALVDK